MSRAIPPFPQYAFMVWCSVKAHGKLYLLPLAVAYTQYSWVNIKTNNWTDTKTNYFNWSPKINNFNMILLVFIGVTFRKMLFSLRCGDFNSWPTPSRRPTTFQMSTTLYSMHSQITPISWGRFVHPQLEDAPCRGDRHSLKMAHTWGK
jgi:hypothetical protein